MRTVRATLAIAGMLSAVASRAGAINPPLPAFLPPRSGEERGLTEPNKKDPAAHVLSPALRPTLCTVHNLHTAEAVVLGPEHATTEDALLSRLLRDRTNWNEHVIDPACIATIRQAVTALGARRVEIVSGYRSDKLNEMLRKKGRHVASRSQHVQGRAVDFRLAGIETVDLWRFVRRVHAGGIGLYRGSRFVHVDTGPARGWRGE